MWFNCGLVGALSVGRQRWVSCLDSVTVGFDVKLPRWYSCSHTHVHNSVKEIGFLISIFSSLVKLWKAVLWLCICSFGNLVWFIRTLVICSQPPCGVCSKLQSNSTTLSCTPELLICTFRCSLFHLGAFVIQTECNELCALETWLCLAN